MKQADDVSFHDITPKDMEKTKQDMGKRFWKTWDKTPGKVRMQYPTRNQGEMGRAQSYYETQASREAYEEDTRRDR
jgi:hypothetical protein